jgi:hypothetical protein
VRPSVLLVVFLIGFLPVACTDSGGGAPDNTGTAGFGGTVAAGGSGGTTAGGSPGGDDALEPGNPVATGGSGAAYGGGGGIGAAGERSDGGPLTDSGSLDGASAGFGATGGADTGIDGSTAGSGGSGGTVAGTGGDGGTDSQCPHSGNIRYTLNRAASPTADELDAYEHLTDAMDQAVWYYNCYTDLDMQLWVNYDPGVPTAQANIDGWMSFGSSRSYMVLPTAMHEIAHTQGVGYYTFSEMSDSNGIWTGQYANAVLASIPDPRDTQLHADSMHFWPYGLNYASEYENEDDLINHCLIVAAIRKDMGL